VTSGLLLQILVLTCISKTQYKTVADKTGNNTYQVQVCTSGIAHD